MQLSHHVQRDTCRTPYSVTRLPTGHEDSRINTAWPGLAAYCGYTVCRFTLEDGTPGTCRYMEDLIFSYTGSIVLTINPYAVASHDQSAPMGGSLPSLLPQHSSAAPTWLDGCRSSMLR